MSTQPNRMDKTHRMDEHAEAQCFLFHVVLWFVVWGVRGKRFSGFWG